MAAKEVAREVREVREARAVREPPCKELTVGEVAARSGLWEFRCR